MLIMAERVNHPPHYNAGGIECIDALEAATSGLQGIEAFCTANAIKYLWRWKLKNGEEDLQKAVWYINRLIQRAGADSAAGKELFNMKENKHGFEPKQEFTMGGIAWTVIQTGADWVKCIASDCVEERAFDEGNKNDFAASSLRAYLNGEFLQCIDALEAATSGLQGIEAFCTANAIKYLWRWKLKNGEEDLQKAVWYINRLIQRAGADSAAGKELFNMKENKHGFEPKQEFTMGGIAWTVIQTGADWVKCIASDCVEERAFDEGNKNDFAASSLRAYLNGEFLRRLIKAGAPEEMFEYFNIDLTADDGLKNYGGDRVRIGLITCEEYRLLRGNIPALPDRWWWTATPDSPINSFVRFVDSVGSLVSSVACYGGDGVRPLCNLKSEILVSYLNGENAEEQKKRAEAVDMMKHIAAAWDIDAEEVFGRADE